MPRVTVILPVFNSEKYLESAVDSILTQSFRDFEFLIHDDGSRDGSPEILKRFSLKDSRIVLTSGHNKGITPTLNEMIERAKGDYIARMDADDISMPDRLESQVKFLDEEPACVAVGSDVALIDPVGRFLTKFSKPVCHEGIDGEHLRGKVLISHPSVMFRKNNVIAIGGYRDTYPHAEDIDLWLRLAEVGHLANIQRMLLKYRLHFSSVSATNRADQIQSHLQAISDAYARRGLGPMPNLEIFQETGNSRSSVYRKWGWWALQSGNIRTAQIYAMKALIRSPFSAESLRLLYCAARGS